jgi:hypothetical protein
MTIELDATEEKALAQAAAARGVALDVYLHEVFKREAQVIVQALAAGRREGLPPIPLEALTSESIYAGRGETTP